VYGKPLTGSRTARDRDGRRERGGMRRTWTSGYPPATGEFKGFRIADCGLRIGDCGLRIGDCGLGIDNAACLIYKDSPPHVGGVGA